MKTTKNDEKEEEEEMQMTRSTQVNDLFPDPVFEQPK